MIEELDRKISKKKDVKSINEDIKIALKKSQRKSDDNFRKISNKFKQELNDILFDDKTTLNLRTSKLMNDELLFNKEDSEITLNKRNDIPEDFVAIAGAGAFVGSCYFGTGLLTATTTTTTQGAGTSLLAWAAGSTTTTAGASTAVLATGGLAVLALITVPTYIYIRNKSIEKLQEKIESILSEIEEKFEENTSEFIRVLEEQKEKTIELILKNIDNDILQAYEDKMKGYTNMQDIRDNPEKIKELDNLINKLNLLKV